MSVDPLDLGRYADILAILHHYRSEPASHLLEALTIDEAHWNTSDAYWTEELSLCFSRRQESIAFEFSSRYAKMRRRLARQGLDLAGALAKLARVAPPEKRTEAAGTAQVARGDGPPPAPELPSYLLEQAMAQKKGPPTSPLPAYVPPPAKLQGTMTGIGGAAPQAPLPFREGASPLASPAPTPAPAAPAGPGTGTAFLPESSPDAGMPRFTGLELGEAATPPATPPMSVEHYAAMVAELNYKPGQDEAVLKRYGLATEAERVNVMRSMASYLMANPLQRSKYEMLLQRFAAWMK